jgi:hypothetical protein
MAGNYLLLESGSTVLLESADRLLLEAAASAVTIGTAQFAVRNLTNRFAIRRLGA